MNLSIGSASELIPADVVASDPDSDVAILKAQKGLSNILFQPTAAFLGPGKPPNPVVQERPPSPKGAVLRTEFPNLGETVLLAGFPLGEETLVLQTGVATGFYSHGMMRVTPPSKGLRLMLSLVSNPGNSGGPVLDTNGRVLGLLEGNLQSSTRDRDGRDLICFRPSLDSNGQLLRNPTNNQPILEPASCLQNSGISVAVPARFVLDLATKSQITF